MSRAPRRPSRLRFCWDPGIAASPAGPGPSAAPTIRAGATNPRIQPRASFHPPRRDSERGNRITPLPHSRVSLPRPGHRENLLTRDVHPVDLARMLLRLSHQVIVIAALDDDAAFAGEDLRHVRSPIDG